MTPEQVLERLGKASLVDDLPIRAADAIDDATDVIQDMAAEIVRLETENWHLKQACGYPIPADKKTPQNPFKCGICDARALSNGWRAFTKPMSED